MMIIKSLLWEVVRLMRHICSPDDVAVVLQMGEWMSISHEWMNADYSSLKRTELSLLSATNV
jgi:hypothetical protein